MPMIQEDYEYINDIYKTWVLLKAIGIVSVYEKK